MFEENRTSGSIRDTIDLTLSWAILPGLAAAVTPPPGEGFSAADFTTSCGTLYLIATGDDDSPVTPLFRALASWVHYEAGLAGSKGRHKRLDPPLLMALDEVTQVCPVDLPRDAADSAGKGVLIVAVCHSQAQLEHRWGKHGADTVWSCCGTKVLLGAISDPDTLDARLEAVRHRRRRRRQGTGRPARAAAHAARLAGAGHPDEPLRRSW